MTQERKREAIKFLEENGFEKAPFGNGMQAKSYVHTIGKVHYSDLQTDEQLEDFKKNVLAIKSEHERVSPPADIVTEGKYKGLHVCGITGTIENWQLLQKTHCILRKASDEGDNPCNYCDECIYYDSNIEDFKIWWENAVK
jgi:hypothetical protein